MVGMSQLLLCTPKRVCAQCGSDKTTINKSGHECWYLGGGDGQNHICRKCYQKQHYLRTRGPLKGRKKAMMMNRTCAECGTDTSRYSWHRLGGEGFLCTKCYKWRVFIGSEKTIPLNVCKERICVEQYRKIMGIPIKYMEKKYLYNYCKWCRVFWEKPARNCPECKKRLKITYPKVVVVGND